MQHILDRVTIFNKKFNKKSNNTSSFHSSISSIGYDKVVLCSICIVLLAISTIFLCPPIFTDDDSSHAITGTSIASDTTLSISLSNNELPLDITPTSASGTFVSTADDDTKASTAVIHVATNNITGYTLGIKASNPVSSSADKLISNNEKCENTPTSNKCAISSLSQPVSSAEYIDNTVEGIDLNNTWGYAPSYYNSTPNTTTTTTLDPNTNENITTTSPINYYPAPVNGDTIATTDAPNQENTTTNDGTLVEDEYTIDYGMRIDYTPYAGNYSTNYNNQSYIITAVGNPVPYSVSYDANKPQQAPAEAEVDNMPTAQTGSVASGDTVAVILNTKVPTLGNNNPTTGEYEYAGYVFNGWCSVQPEEDNVTGYQTCPQDANTFQPGDNFGIDQTVENTQILYATWGAPAAVILNGNGLTYSDTAVATENIMTFIPTYADGKVTSNKVNVIETGIYRTPILSTTENYIFKGWSEDQNATEATYTDEQDIMNNINLNADDAITLYAIWAYTTVITFDGNGADSGSMSDQTIVAGTPQNLTPNAFAKEGYIFASWNTNEDGSGTSYADQAEYTASTTRPENTTLYVQWKVPTLYDKVAAMSKGTQTLAQFQETITAPTTTDYTADTSNSGVYEYNSSVFGEASDASNANKIYYYRGVLEPRADQGSYGSDGKATTYPNYVRLSNDTCWRIVRTTGSGGVKMIYNGKWWTGSTCANSTSNADAVSSVYFNRGTTRSTNNYGTKGRVAYVGYNYNSDYGYGGSGANEDNSIANSTLFSNGVASNARTQLESWYNSNITAYTSILETSAGYCNDRTTYTGTTADTLASSTVPYKTSSAIVNFGAYIRNMTANDHPTLGCPNTTGQDLLTTSNGLDVPAALLTADEASFAGSGNGDSNGPPYHANSFLRSGSYFWLLSPYNRYSGGNAHGFILYSGGDLGAGYVSNGFGVRPVISLKPGTTAASGTGIATDPWIVTVP